MNKKRPGNVFRRSRCRIVLVLLAGFLLLFTATLAAIYLTSYQELYRGNLDMLENYIQLYQKNGNPGLTQTQPQKDFRRDFRRDDDGNRFALASFYSVEFNPDGDAVSVDSGLSSLYSREQLIQISPELSNREKQQGIYDNFIYSVTDLNGQTLVALMDNTLVTDSFTTLFQNTLLVGSIMALVLLLCSIVLARWIIRPLEESDRQQRQFLSDAGHELKTPVSVVNANAELLSRQIGPNQWLENIQFENNRMADLISHLLLLVRTEQVQIPLEPVDLSRIVTGGILPFESIAFEQGFQIQSEIQKDIIISGNTLFLDQLVSIFLDNALSHSSHPGTIQVSLSRCRGGCLFTVSNLGSLTFTDEKEIFSRFTRGEKERSGNGEHYGLGLAIAKNIVIKHHGNIQVSCREEIITFSVFFPIRQRKS